MMPKAFFGNPMEAERKRRRNQQGYAFFAMGQQGENATNYYEHPTPDAVFDACDKEFGPFTLDPATALGYHSGCTPAQAGVRIETRARSSWRQISISLHPRSGGGED